MGEDLVVLVQTDASGTTETFRMTEDEAEAFGAQARAYGRAIVQRPGTGFCRAINVYQYRVARVLRVHHIGGPDAVARRRVGDPSVLGGEAVRLPFEMVG